MYHYFLPQGKFSNTHKTYSHNLERNTKNFISNMEHLFFNENHYLKTESIES